ncbi:beta-galactosidase [Enterococcus casseliflavus]|uniref:beta-galactosidase n=1 Tax=Enterococcus casseliflavus TaxID=37734 RepID=UPI002DBC9E0D|nr:beta-galactosidase [Enterococcus casseliflavus]MEB8417657.1 beta-galactosidase [Enterococcus casseliflavus]
MTRYNLEERFLHGGDYNPDQWLNYPEILAKDLELMEKAHANTFSLGIFAWSALEPAEGVFQFEWLDKIMDELAERNSNVILATPSGARPAWLSKAYPEVLRTNEKREKMLHGGRHNHCFSSLIYREKVAIINRKLAERYHDHPALLMWHISNEYSGDCHCPICQENFRQWVKQKYQTLAALNEAWWGPFWSHTITDWSQIESPSPIGEMQVHGLNLDWHRFVTDQTIDFYEHEIKDIRRLSPDVPITTNFMADTRDLIPFYSLDYGKFAQHVDVISWDCYPAWHNDWGTTADLASKVGFINDQYRSLKKQPFLIMESTPSGVNWHPVNRTKRPGMHLLSSMQFIAHGSDSNLYFQWRKSRGSSEKFHGAVVDHDNDEQNRVFQDVAEVGKALEEIKEIKGLHKKAKVAIIYDWDNNWALNDAQGFGLESKRYPQTLQEHYRYFWDHDIAVDVITKDHDFDAYQLIIAPMLYLLPKETMKKFQQYTNNGGTLVSTYLTGIVNETDLTYLGGWPQELEELFGVSVKEIDTLYPKQKNLLLMKEQQYQIHDYCSVVQTNTAQTLGVYGADFYQGQAAVTVNDYGEGSAYYLGGRTDQAFLEDFYQEIIQQLRLQNEWVRQGSTNVSIQSRESQQEQLAPTTYYFVMNFSEENQEVEVATSGIDLLTGKTTNQKLQLAPYEVQIIKVTAPEQ